MGDPLPVRVTRPLSRFGELYGARWEPSADAERISRVSGRERHGRASASPLPSGGSLQRGSALAAVAFALAVVAAGGCGSSAHPSRASADQRGPARVARTAPQRSAAVRRDRGRIPLATLHGRVAYSYGDDV